MGYSRQLESKTIGFSDIAGLLPGHKTIDIGYGTSIHPGLERLIVEAVTSQKLAGVDIQSMLYPFKHDEDFMALLAEGAMTYTSRHFSTQDRRLADQGLCTYIPLHFGHWPGCLRYGPSPDIDLVITEVAPMDRKGNLSFSLATSYLKALCERVRSEGGKVIVIVNDQQPRISGHRDSYLHIDDVDWVVAGASHGLPALPLKEPSEVDRAVGRYVSSLIEGGETLQLGIGGLPIVITEELIAQGKKDFGVRSEMLTDGFIKLHKAGCVSNSNKPDHKGVSEFAFAMGSAEMYEYLRKNPELFYISPVNITNDPYLVAKQYKPVCINSAVKVDLYGQACSESASFRHLTGVGGQFDFVYGALRSRLNGGEGKSIICLPATHTDGATGEEVSNIVLDLNAGDVVTDPRPVLNYIVTEHGIADLFGKSIAERVEALAGIASPKFTDDLLWQAKEKGLLK